MRIAAEKGLTVMSHAEDIGQRLFGGNVAHVQPVSYTHLLHRKAGDVFIADALGGTVVGVYMAHLGHGGVHGTDVYKRQLPNAGGI